MREAKWYEIQYIVEEVEIPPPHKVVFQCHLKEVLQSDFSVSLKISTAEWDEASELVAKGVESSAAKTTELAALRAQLSSEAAA